MVLWKKPETGRSSVAFRRLRAEAVLTAYRARNIVPGKRVTVLRPGADPRAALALDIGPDFSLRVRYGDGTEESLRTGEVSVRPGP